MSNCIDIKEVQSIEAPHTDKNMSIKLRLRKYLAIVSISKRFKISRRQTYRSVDGRLDG